MKPYVLLFSDALSLFHTSFIRVDGLNFLRSTIL